MSDRYSCEQDIVDAQTKAILDAISMLKKKTVKSASLVGKGTKWDGFNIAAHVSDTVEEGKTNILNRLYFCTEREELPSAMIYRDDSSAMFADYLAERFNNCMLGVSGDYVVNFTDAGRHASAGKSIVDYVIVIIDENNLDQLVK